MSLREVIDGFITENPQALKVVDNVGTESGKGFLRERCEKLAMLFGQRFRLVVTESLVSLQLCCRQLMEWLVTLVNDPDVWVPKWCRHGWPLGIVHPIHPLGVFPAVDKATAAAEESRMYGRALIEHPVPLDQHRNYQSFREAQEEAEDDLDRVIRGKFA